MTNFIEKLCGVVRIPDQLNRRLSDLAKQTKCTRSYHIEKALQDYLDDYEDYLIALTRLEKKNSRIAFEDFENRFRWRI